MTEPIGAIDDDDSSRSTTRPAIAIPRVPRETAATERNAPVTVIPVPVLPTIQGTASAGRLQPVVRTTTPVPPASLHRFAKGTGPVPPSAETHAASAMSDDTDPNVSVGDRTRPGIGLPPAARTIGLPTPRRPSR